MREEEVVPLVACIQAHGEAVAQAQGYGIERRSAPTLVPRHAAPALSSPSWQQGGMGALFRGQHCRRGLPVTSQRSGSLRVEAGAARLTSGQPPELRS